MHVAALRSCGSSWLEAISEVGKVNPLVAVWAGTTSRTGAVPDDTNDAISRRSQGGCTPSCAPPLVLSFSTSSESSHLLPASRNKVILPIHSFIEVTTKLCSYFHSLSLLARAVYHSFVDVSSSQAVYVYVDTVLCISVLIICVRVRHGSFPSSSMTDN